jgi:hypothetical protein
VERDHLCALGDSAGAGIGGCKDCRGAGFQRSSLALHRPRDALTQPPDDPAARHVSRLKKKKKKKKSKIGMEIFFGQKKKHERQMCRQKLESQKAMTLILFRSIDIFSNCPRRFTAGVNCRI